jgi:hypothetical protein
MPGWEDDRRMKPPHISESIFLALAQDFSGASGSFHA